MNKTNILVTISIVFIILNAFLAFAFFGSPTTQMNRQIFESEYNSGHAEESGEQYQKDVDKAYRDYRLERALWFFYPEVGGDFKRGLIFGAIVAVPDLIWFLKNKKENSYALYIIVNFLAMLMALMFLYFAIRILG